VATTLCVKLTVPQNKVAACRQTPLLCLAARILQCEHLPAAVRSGRYTRGRCPVHKRVDQVGALLHQPGFPEHGRDSYSGLPTDSTQLTWCPGRTLRPAAHVQLTARYAATEPSDPADQLWWPPAELAPGLRQGPQSFHVLPPRPTRPIAAFRP
jgi:hypothetical protein